MLSGMGVDGQADGNTGTPLLVGGVLGASLVGALIWTDLRQPPTATSTWGGGPHGGTVWATQFGPDDEVTAALPAGLGLAYQKVLIPGETDRLLELSQPTLRGLIYPFEQVRHLRTPAELHGALGLGFPIADDHGQTVIAFPADADHLDVIRFNGIRDEDLIVPVGADVEPPAEAAIPWVVRQHARPWTGSSEAPGSVSTALIEEFELLAEAAVTIPHLAEIWRLTASGSAEHVASYNAREGRWTGDAVSVQLVGTPVANGLHAAAGALPLARAVAVNDHEHVLARLPQAERAAQPDQVDGQPAGVDGLVRTVVANESLTRVVGVATLASYRDARVRLLRRSGTHSLVDYVGGDHAEAARLGFRQLGQSEWEPRWVPGAEITNRTRLERSHPLPREAEELSVVG